MFITSKTKVNKPVEISSGERIYEMIGITKNLSDAKNHSVSYVVIPPNCSSKLHYHIKAEETYYILKGRARMVINGEDHLVCSGDVIFILPLEKHQIFTQGMEDLEFITICAPPWNTNDNIYVDH